VRNVSFQLPAGSNEPIVINRLSCGFSPKFARSCWDAHVLRCAIDVISTERVQGEEATPWRRPAGLDLLGGTHQPQIPPPSFSPRTTTAAGTAGVKACARCRYRWSVSHATPATHARPHPSHAGSAGPDTRPPSPTGGLFDRTAGADGYRPIPPRRPRTSVAGTAGAAKCARCRRRRAASHAPPAARAGPHPSSAGNAGVREAPRETTPAGRRLPGGPPRPRRPLARRWSPPP